MASKHRKMFYQNKKQETTEIGDHCTMRQGGRSKQLCCKYLAASLIGWEILSRVQLCPHAHTTDKRKRETIYVTTTAPYPNLSRFKHPKLLDFAINHPTIPRYTGGSELVFPPPFSSGPDASEKLELYLVEVRWVFTPGSTPSSQDKHRRCKWSYAWVLHAPTEMTAEVGPRALRGSAICGRITLFASRDVTIIEKNRLRRL
ncbi:hypothetical protein AAG570_009305 [Ranatra chinensis]|uniref:Uncharacterized protein n=1 Tax=Ranatra chinensis TaxID=642074 RepID=A0ABD0ZC10_9HEMI